MSKGFLPLLVTGIAGVAGYNAFQYFSRKYPGQVIGTRRPENWPLRGPGIESCEAANSADWERLFDRYQFAAVLNCEGSCALKSCELDPPMAERINVGGVRNLLEQVAGADTYVCHLSIDLVFSGTGSGRYAEAAPTDPVTVYGKTMVEAERLVLDRRPRSCILRISLPMGISFNGHAGAIDWIQSRFRKGLPATLYYDEVRSPTYTDCLNELFEEILERRMHGLFHSGGPRYLSLYEIAQVVNRVGGYDPALLIGCFRKEAGPMPPRAGNVTMNSELLSSSLGYEPFVAWPRCDSLEPTHREWHRERGDEPGSPEWLARILYQRPPAPPSSSYGIAANPA